MNFFTKNLSKAHQPTNPLKAVLEIIPYTDTIVDPKLLDSIILEFMRVGFRNVSNSAVMALLLDMEKAELLTLTCYEYPSALGQLFIIKRNT